MAADVLIRARRLSVLVPRHEDPSKALHGKSTDWGNGVGLVTLARLFRRREDSEALWCVELCKKWQTHSSIATEKFEDLGGECHC